MNRHFRSLSQNVTSENCLLHIHNDEFVIHNVFLVNCFVKLYVFFLLLSLLHKELRFYELRLNDYTFGFDFDVLKIKYLVEYVSHILFEYL